VEYKRTSYKLSELFDVETVGPDHYSRRSYVHMKPFDLDFRLKSSKRHSELMHGPGVYQIFFEKILVYVGKFDTLNDGNVAEERWRKHLETITLRGNRVGFTSPKSVQKLIDLMCDKKLISALTVEKKNLKKRLRDTGVVSSQNRICFANKNWSKFSKLSKRSLGELFAVEYYRFININKKSEAERYAKMLEERLIDLYRPECNYQCSKKNPSKEATLNQARKSTRGLIKEMK
jgi:hypothetical protein